MNYDIETIKIKMLIKYPFFGSVVSNVDYKETEDVKTAATDGETIYYSKKYLDSLSNDEQVFVFAHEVCHIAFNHILRSEGKNQKIWNIATDAVINQFLKKDRLKLAPNVIDIEEAINYNAEEYYEKLLKQNQKEDAKNGGNGEDENTKSQKQSKEKNGSNSGNSNEKNDNLSNQDDSNNIEDNQKNFTDDGIENTKSSKKGEESDNNSNASNSKEDTNNLNNQNNSDENESFNDSHSMWAEAVRKHKEKKDSKQNGELNDNKEDKKNEIEDNQKKLQKIGEKEAFEKNKEEKKKELEKFKEEIINEASQAGNDTHMDIRNIDNIGNSKPLLDWRYVLKEAIKYELDWSYQNASIENGVVTPNLEEQPMPETEILLDTSGSINTNLLKRFLKECKNILVHTKLKVGCFDTQFYGFTEIRCDDDIENMEYVGGGGTDFDVAVNAFTRRVENKIIFTDGGANMPKEALDVIWLVFGYNKIQPKGGKVIYVDKNELKIIDSKVKMLRR